MTTTKKLKAQGITGGPQLTIWEDATTYPDAATWDPATASTTEILAKLLGPATERVCENLTGAYTDLRDLASAHPADLHAIGFSLAAIERLAALVEFSKRFGEQEFVPGTPFRGSADIYAHFREASRANPSNISTQFSSTTRTANSVTCSSPRAPSRPASFIRVTFTLKSSATAPPPSHSFTTTQPVTPRPLRKTSRSPAASAKSATLSVSGSSTTSSSAAAGTFPFRTMVTGERFSALNVGTASVPPGRQTPLAAFRPRHRNRSRSPLPTQPNTKPRATAMRFPNTGHYPARESPSARRASQI